MPRRFSCVPRDRPFSLRAHDGRLARVARIHGKGSRGEPSPSSLLRFLRQVVDVVVGQQHLDPIRELLERGRALGDW